MTKFLKEYSLERKNTMKETRIIKKILFKSKTGEYTPYNKNDDVLLKWCNDYNSKLKKGLVLELDTPIRSNLLYYYTPYKKDKALVNWCKNKNEELKQNRKIANNIKTTKSDF